MSTMVIVSMKYFRGREKAKGIYWNSIEAGNRKGV